MSSSSSRSGPVCDVRFTAQQVPKLESLCQQQVALIEHLRTHGHDIVEAEELLAKLQDTLAVMRRLQQQLTAKEPKTP